MKILNFVNYESFKFFALENGVPGAEEFTTDFLVFNGSIAGGAPNGAITQPADAKLSNEYEYYVAEIRISDSFLDGTAAAIGGQAYVPSVEAQHVAFALNADGRTRGLFRSAIPFRAMRGQGYIAPFSLPAPAAFSGSEKVSCLISFNGQYNPASIAAQLDFTIIVQCAIIKTEALRKFERYLKTSGQMR